MATPKKFLLSDDVLATLSDALDDKIDATLTPDATAKTVPTQKSIRERLAPLYNAKAQLDAMIAKRAAKVDRPAESDDAKAKKIAAKKAAAKAARAVAKGTAKGGKGQASEAPPAPATPAQQAE